MPTLQFPLAVFLVTIAALIHSGNSLQCYICDSDHTSACKDNVKSLQLHDCTSATTYNNGDINTAFAKSVNLAANYLTNNNGESHNICAAATFTSLDRTITERICTYDSLKPCELLQQIIAAEKGTVHNCYTCSTDGCNSAGITETVSTFIIGSVLISTLVGYSRS